jgi:SOS response regulatory protein OraA/RecX
MNDGAREWSSEAKTQYNKVRKEHKAEFRREKTVQELAKKGFNHAAISGMMGDMSERNVKNMIRKTGNIKLDGRY